MALDKGYRLEHVFNVAMTPVVALNLCYGGLRYVSRVLLGGRWTTDIPILPAPNAATGDAWRRKRTRRTEQITGALNAIVVPMAGLGCVEELSDA